LVHPPRQVDRQARVTGEPCMRCARPPPPAHKRLPAYGRQDAYLYMAKGETGRQGRGRGHGRERDGAWEGGGCQPCCNLHRGCQRSTCKYILYNIHTYIYTGLACLVHPRSQADTEDRLRVQIRGSYAHRLEPPPQTQVAPPLPLVHGEETTACALVAACA
jgi:hypothetical protein